MMLTRDNERLTMKKEMKIPNINVQLWKGIALASGIFSFIISVLIIVNYIQINQMDPVNVEPLNALIERLSEHPEDTALRDQVRELDLLARKAYFTSRWQVRTGGYLLLIGVAIMIIALQLISLAKKKSPVVASQNEEDLLLTQKKARIWISVVGAVLVALALLFTFMTHNQLGYSLEQATVEIIEEGIATNTGNKAPVSTETEIVAATPGHEDTLASKDSRSASAGNEIENSITSSTGSEPENSIAASAGSGPENSETASEEGPAITHENYITGEIRANFPSFRGPGGNGFSYKTNIPVHWDGATGENILWKITIPLHGYNSPIIWGDRLFLTGAEASRREVFCIDRHTGKIQWTATADDIPGSPQESPEVTDDTGQAAPTMTTDGKRVYAIFATGDIIALDMEGKRIWAKNLGLPRNHYGHSSSLMMYKDKLIVQYDHGRSARLIALQGNTGDIAWSTERKVKISWASPIIVYTGMRNEIILVADPYIASYDPETGKELWRVDGMTGEVGPSAVYADGVVFALNEYASLMAIRIGDTAEVIWKDYEYLSDVPSPVATDKYLFVATSYGVLVCYEAKTGQLLWEHEFDHGFYSSPMIVEDKVYLLDRKGVMHIFKPDKEYISIGAPALGENSVCTPVFANGRIYIRAGNNLYCIGS
jgi:outer membrane protein assembly factor BamB